MNVNHYRYTDADAPVLTGQAGSLVNLLDKCLVNGYGAKESAGWDIAFTAIDKRAYRASDVGGNRRFLRVVDDGSGSGGAQEALVVMLDSMTDIDTGDSPCPAISQLSAGLVWRKSDSANETSRHWYLSASPSAFILFVRTRNEEFFDVYGMGDGKCFDASATYFSFIAGRERQNVGTSGIYQNFAYQTSGRSTGQASSDHGLFVRNNYAGVGPYRAPLYQQYSQRHGSGSNTSDYPYPVGGGLLAGVPAVGSGVASTPAGEMPLLISHNHAQTAINSRQEFAALPEFGGRGYINIRVGQHNNGGAQGNLMLQISGAV
jgi:hypothetical protein